MELPRNAFKAALKAGKPQFGLWVSIPDPGLTEALAMAGYDWLLIDTEHTPVEPSAVMGLLQAAAPYPVSMAVRPVENHTALIKRYLDIGAQTLLLPYVQSRAAAAAAVAAVRYGPRGVRGVAGITRATRYGKVAGYFDKADDEICLLVQVETVQALAALDEIATTPGVDGVFIGPADLAASMGYPGKPGHPDVVARCLETIGRLKALGVPSGILTLDRDLSRRFIAAGTSFTALGVDLALLNAGAAQLLAEFR